MKRLLLLTSLLAMTVSAAWAQSPQMDETRETLRFIRLAETRKKLDLDEATLIKLNELLDTYENKKFELKMEERHLQKDLSQGVSTNEDNNALLDRYAAIRKGTLEAELNLITDVRALLNPAQSVRFFQFYQKFQRDVQQRIRRLQHNRGNGRAGGNGMRPGRNH